ncbi:DnaB-like helicase C-terminal domain-containing protein, partial [Klebsiella pneumoniae]
LYHQGSDVTGLPTGFSDFDQLTSGLQNGDLVIVAGRPSMGKTTFAMNIGENVAMNSDTPVAVFSMEMPGDALAMRMLSSLGRVE